MTPESRVMKAELSQNHVKIVDLKPGMEGLSLTVALVEISEVRELTSKIGRFHKLIDGVVQDSTGRMAITFWDDRLDFVQSIKIGDVVEISDCFVSSFRGERRINVGRGSSVKSVNEL